MRVIDTSPLARFGAGHAGGPGLIVLPLETHCLLIGGSALAIVRTDCGHAAFLRSRERWEGPIRQADAVFGQSGMFTWQADLRSDRLEELAEELLAVEPGVVRVRSAGPHTERDQGRDLIVDWLQIVDATSDPPTLRTDTILVQVKSRNRTVGKGDVRDVRDTIERHGATGFLLVAHPEISGDLVNYLETLRQRGEWIEWWGRKQIEERLRRNLHVAARYTDIVRYHSPADPDARDGC